MPTKSSNVFKKKNGVWKANTTSQTQNVGALTGSTLVKFDLLSNHAFPREHNVQRQKGKVSFSTKQKALVIVEHEKLNKTVNTKI